MSKEELLKHTLLLKRFLKRRSPVKLKLFGTDCAGMAFLLDDPRFISLSVIAYSCAKFFEKHYISQNSKWLDLVSALEGKLENAAEALELEREKEFDKILASCLALLEGLGKELGRFIVNTVDKARIKAATNIYGRGASLGRASELGGVDKKELSNYIGQTNLSDRYSTIDLKKRLAFAESLFD